MGFNWCFFHFQKKLQVLDQVHFKKIYNDWISQHLYFFFAFLKKITMTGSSHFLSPNGQGLCLMSVWSIFFWQIGLNLWYTIERCVNFTELISCLPLELLKRTSKRLKPRTMTTDTQFFCCPNSNPNQKYLFGIWIKKA